MSLRGLAGKVGIVVGGATGLGAATAVRLGAEGSQVVIGDIAEEAAQQTAERIARAGVRRHGIGALTRHVASRWGKEGIRCNAVAPGFTATDAIRSAPRWPELEASALRRIRSTRVGLPDDVASLVAFLLSDEGAWINGQVVNIDGGTVLR
ncbi:MULTISPECIES: SDR family NAD(P)-dependent oxidoreductase [unclassified Mycobacterium]|uniref:SDR family NAD(P)-dependent oxidoreductase n=1 Tax=unclassified Mycobacterium TaxID=2642494 RepID=UPI0007FB7C08|nr:MULTISPECIES: SDR family oxidoreductase [unclassified Mycobacterium]OBH08250.1 hypothetical protein A5696_20175 [Mycobacterium sp. E2699]OBI56527.1 hypothetical protein A5705_22030 [Mycobacterium sp. E787]